MYVSDIVSCMAASSSLAASLPDGAASAAAPSAVPYKEKASARACHGGNHKGLPWRNSQQRCIHGLAFPHSNRQAARRIIGRPSVRPQAQGSLLSAMDSICASCCESCSPVRSFDVRRPSRMRHSCCIAAAWLTSGAQMYRPAILTPATRPRIVPTDAQTLCCLRTEYKLT